MIPLRNKPLAILAAVIAVAAAAAVSTFRRSAAVGKPIPTAGSPDSATQSRLFENFDPHQDYSGVELQYPYDHAVFPPEAIAPIFSWSLARTEESQHIDTWLVQVSFETGEPIRAVLRDRHWLPTDQQWSTFKAHTADRPARVAVLGLASTAPKGVRVGKVITLSTSTDPVGAPLFYREVPLPFIEAVKDPARIRWRFGTIDSPSQPPVVLEGLPVCGNCHSFSANGAVLGMDVDYANDKGSYAILNTGHEMRLAKERIITWSDFRRNDKQPTFGLLSQVSPDGRYAVSTVKDRSVFVAKSELAFSQLFFPIKGILAIHDRETGTFQALPGADDPAYVQSNPVWSPDGKYIVFARAKAYTLKHFAETGTALLKAEDCEEFLNEGKTFQFDLYRIPFNGGKGGKAEPLRGASLNGMSNYFAKYSPDGKWIAFCRSSSFMLLQPDSELYIVPAEGGEARRLEANTNRMNSWHSWSPNSRWMVFSSKANTPYTQLFLTHLDEAGHSSPPILLAQLSASDRAANIPEFVNLPPKAIERITAQFVDDLSFARAGFTNSQAKDPKHAMQLYRQALSLNPDNVRVLIELSGLLIESEQLQDAATQLNRALRLAPNDVDGHYYLALTRMKLGQVEPAVQLFQRVVELDPKHAAAYSNLGGLLLQLDRAKEAERALRRAIEADPKNASAHHNLGVALASLGRKKDAIQQWEEEVRLEPSNVEAQQHLASVLLESGAVDQALHLLESALRVKPTETATLLAMAKAYERKGDLLRAREATEQAARAARENHEPALQRESQRRLQQYAGKLRQ